MKLDKKLLRYAKIAKYGNSKRMRKKAWNLLIDLCGYDNEGLVNYAKVSRYIQHITSK